MGISVSTGGTGLPNVSAVTSDMTRLSTNAAECIHTDKVYNALLAAVASMEDRLNVSLENYKNHPDVQANLQQLQYDLQQWNLALTTMTNINKNMGDALSSIASNFR